MTNKILIPQEAERIIFLEIPYIRERMSIYGWTAENLNTLKNPYDLANILPDELYDYAKDCDIDYYTSLIADLLLEEEENY